MYYMTPTRHLSWTSKGLTSVLRDSLPELDLTSVTTLHQALDAAPVVDVAARQARIDGMAKRLKQLVQVADAPASAAVTA